MQANALQFIHRRKATNAALSYMRETVTIHEGASIRLPNGRSATTKKAIQGAYISSRYGIFRIKLKGHGIVSVDYKQVTVHD